MHPRSAEVLAYLDEQHVVLRDAYESVPPERRSDRLAPNQWSAADVITHLAMIENRVAKVFAKTIAEGRARGISAESDVSPVLPTIDLARMLDRSRKLNAPAPINPIDNGASLGWDDFETGRSALKAAFLDGDGLALNELTAPHPIFGPLGMYEWVVFVGAHCARHAMQLREIDAAARTKGQ
jgi:hypothetical protein